VNALQEGVTQFEELSTAVAEDLDGMTPPDEAADAHQSLVESFEAGAEALGNVAVDLETIESEDEFLALSDEISTQFGELEAATTAACEELQSQADSANISVDLGCGE
jgi:hypothetical protein